MIPKIIHYTWFSGDEYPAKIKACIASWNKILPDYKLRLWDMNAIKEIDSVFLKEALSVKKWAYAADFVRLYALYNEGGVYMDSDIFIYRRFDEFMNDKMVTFNECFNREGQLGLQAAFFIGEAGNEFCKKMVEYYSNRDFVLADGTLDLTVSPMVMRKCALQFGYQNDDVEQHLGALTVYPTRFLTPTKSHDRHPDAIGMHRVYHSWRKRKFGRRIELKIKHAYNVVKYFFFKR
jgi:mannosyltransferase OCH1-like enzyme